ncbi:MAG: (2Fe-2S)-binding protein [Gammaproteobacteria bacterium]|nr:(2Fe-2S)-binding protein [Gammaproteobacteria bacterium]
MSRRVTIIVDGEIIEVEESVLLGFVLHEVKNKRLRLTRSGSPRGLFCAMGVCFDCLVRVDGRPGIRACLEPVRDGMRIETTP